MKVRLNGAAVLDAPPVSPTLTDYDRQHFPTYIMLLDAHTAGAPLREAVEYIFAFDGPYDAQRAQKIYDSHLARAQWMTHTGYRLVLREG